MPAGSCRSAPAARNGFQRRTRPCMFPEGEILEDPCAVGLSAERSEAGKPTAAGSRSNALRRITAIIYSSQHAPIRFPPRTAIIVPNSIGLRSPARRCHCSDGLENEAGVYPFWKLGAIPHSGSVAIPESTGSPPCPSRWHSKGYAGDFTRVAPYFRRTRALLSNQLHQFMILLL